MRFRLAWIASLIVVVLFAGCSRRYFRTRTDNDVVNLLTEKDQYPDWAIEKWHVYPDPRSRFADPDNPDRPHRPPDDLAAELLSPNPQPGKPGKVGLFHGTGYLKHLETWDQENRAKRTVRGAKPSMGTTPNQPTKYEEGSTFQAVLESREQPFLINLEQAAELALFNSREFQDRREDLYAAALPVSLERFAFASQFFATEQLIRDVGGSGTSGGKTNRWRLNSDGEMNQYFPTGALLVVKLANRLVLELANGKVDTGISQLSVELTQPLLRGGGWAVALEPLTQAERSLLYAIRSYARFRKVYYVSIAGGADILNSPYSYAGLTQRGIGPSLTAPAQGYFPTLLLKALERNELANIAGLERYWRQFQAFEEGGDVSRLQVDQVEQQLLRGRSSLLQRRLDLQNALDSLKLQLGVPTQVPLELEDQALQPLSEHLALFDQLRTDFEKLQKGPAGDVEGTQQAIGLLGGGILSTTPIDIQLRPRLVELLTHSPAVKGTKFRERILQRWAVWEKMRGVEIKEVLGRLADQRRTLLETKARLEIDGKKLTAEQEQRLVDLGNEINLGKFEAVLRIYEAKPWLREPADRQRREQGNYLRDLLNQYTLVIAEPREERLEKVRSKWPTLPPIQVGDLDLVGSDMDRAHTVATQTALQQRLDLMNARGQLVDSWRQIAVRANALQGVLDLKYTMSTATPSGDHEPVNFGYNRTSHQWSLSGELPLVRRAERNNYRVALISYQRQRRTLQATEDFILNDVRTGLRQLRVLAENYKIQQRAVEVAFAQVENSLDVLQAPPDPRAQGGQNAGNAAALTQQLLNAQSSLLQAQNNLYTVWVNYLVARMQFFRDLELLPLDPRGVWTDEYLPLEPAPERPFPEERLPEPEPILNSRPPRFAELRDGGPVLPAPRKEN